MVAGKLCVERFLAGPLGLRSWEGILRVSAPGALGGTYSGYAFSSAGDKGRFVLPPALRKAVKDSSGGAKTLCLSAHEKFGCLIGFGVSRIEKLQKQLDDDQERAVRLGDAEFDYTTRAQQLFGFEQVPFDDSGRFIMPDYLRDLDLVGDGLFFQGAGDFFLIWNPEELARMGPAYKGAQAACRKQIADAAVKAKAKGAKK